MILRLYFEFQLKGVFIDRMALTCAARLVDSNFPGRSAVRSVAGS